MNEALDYSGGDHRLRESIFLKKPGDGYIADAYQLTHEVDPNALLFYNDYENYNPKPAYWGVIQALEGRAQ